MRTLAIATAVLLAAIAAFADFSDRLPPALNHPAIGYFRAANDPVAKLNARLIDGSVELAYAERGGYLKSVLDALGIPVESQLLVQSKTSLQAELISPTNPRSIFFNDSVAVAWMYGGFIEVAAQDSQQGVVFYTMQQARGEPRFERNDQCLRCHQSDTSLGMPGMIVRSIAPGPGGEPMLIYGGSFPDHRTPLEQRWGGWYVTGVPAGVGHMGNARVTDRDKPDIVNSQPLASMQGKYPVERYLSPYSDAAALLVFDHQMYAMGLLTRLSWETRAGTQEQRKDLDRVIEEGAKELVDYFLFVDEVPLRAQMGGAAGYAAKFSAQGPRDAKGRSLRQLNLRTRLLEYPCSYLIYSDAFDGLPSAAKTAVYRRMWQVLSGADQNEKYARMPAANRQAVIEILRETKPEVREYFR